MRQALNENPVVQAAVIGIVGIAFAVIFFMQMGGGGDSADSTVADPITTPPAETATTASAAPATTPSDSAPATPAAPPATSEGAAGSAPASGAGVRSGKGIPADVLAAYRRNKAIALLVVAPRGAASPLVKRSTKRLAKRDDVAVFVVRANEIARYARITAGLPVTRVPALVVVRPRKLSGKQPTATVSYGFRGPPSVRQAIDDALYKGGQVPSYPFRDRR